MNDTTKPRPEFRNLNLFRDLTYYRMPLAALTSILHRVSGAIMFLLLPLVLWIFDRSVTSQISHDRLVAVFDSGFGWLLKLVCLGLIWAFLHHLCAGIRHIYMDIDPTIISLKFGRRTAAATLIISGALTVILGAKLFGLY